MKEFEEIIKKYLDERAKNDPEFAETYAKENKSIAECVRYIVGEARKKASSVAGGRCAALPDEEVFGWAVHYYDEDDIKVEDTTANTKVTTSANTTEKKEEKDDLDRAEEEVRKAESANKKKSQPTRQRPQVVSFELF